jgi:hypothetical protein
MITAQTKTIYVSRICIVERIRISYFLALSRVTMFYATTEQKFIHSFWNALRICWKINQLHQSSFYTSSIYYTTQNNPWICRYRFNGKVFFYFFCITPRTHKIKKSTVEFHTSKNDKTLYKSLVKYIKVYVDINDVHWSLISC